MFHKCLELETFKLEVSDSKLGTNKEGVRAGKGRAILVVLSRIKMCQENSRIQEKTQENPSSEMLRLVEMKKKKKERKESICIKPLSRSLSMNKL